MKVHFKRLISSFLAVALSVTMLVVPAVPASAASGGWSAFKEALADTFLTASGAPISADDLPDFTFKKTGPVTKDELDEQCRHYNSFWGTWLRDYGMGLGIVDSIFGSHAVSGYDPESGVFRPKDAKTNEWIVDRSGAFPYFSAGGDTPDEIGANTPAPPSVSRNKFIDVKNLNLENIQLVVVTEDALAESVQLINDDGITCTMTKASINGAYYWVIMRSGGTSAAYYCNSAGQPYVALYEDTATDLDFDYIVNNNTDNSVVVEDSQIINIEDGEFTLIDDSGEKVTLTIDNLIFDTSTKNYTLNAYNTVEEGDNYYYTYYNIGVQGVQTR